MPAGMARQGQAQALLLTRGVEQPLKEECPAPSAVGGWAFRPGPLRPVHDLPTSECAASVHRLTMAFY